MDGHLQLFEQPSHPFLDLVADGPDRVEVLAGRVLQNPLLVAAAGEDRARVTAAHGDHGVGGLDDLVGPRLGGVLVRDVDAHFGHRRDGRGG